MTTLGLTTREPVDEPPATAASVGSDLATGRVARAEAKRARRNERNLRLARHQHIRTIVDRIAPTVAPAFPDPSDRQAETGRGLA